MNVKTKIIVSIFIVLVLFGGGLLTGYVIRKASDNKRFAEYTATIKSLGHSLAEFKDANNKLADSNSRLERTVAEVQREHNIAIERAGKAERIISEIESGLSGSTDDIQRLIAAIDRVIKKVRAFGED